jgi:hypothetical protein
MSEPIAIRNNSNETIPAFGVMRITGANVDNSGQSYLTVEKPNANFETYYLINGPFQISVGKYGVATDQYPCYALYNDGDGAPSYGQSWGAKNAQWKLGINRDGFDILGNPTNGRVLVRQHKVTQLKGKLAADINSGSTASATVWIESGASEYSVTLQDWMIPSGDKILSGTPIIGLLINGVWYLIAGGDCPKPA